MALLTFDTPMSVALEQYPSLIPLVSRFGIRLGLGDKTVAAVCAEHRIDADFMLILMNTYLFDEYFPEQRLKSFHVSQIVDYLSKTNAYYLHYQLPNIERHLERLIAGGGNENKQLALLGQFFDRFKQSLIAAIDHDTRVWFPECLARSADDGETNVRRPLCPPKTAAEEEEDPTVSQLRDLRSIMVRHLSGSYDDNLAYAVIFAVGSIERDIRQHNRIRDRILTPLIDALCRE